MFTRTLSTILTASKVATLAVMTKALSAVVALRNRVAVLATDIFAFAAFVYSHGATAPSAKTFLAIPTRNKMKSNTNTTTNQLSCFIHNRQMTTIAKK